MSADPMVTRTGKVLTEAEIDALAVEAERGYDVSTLTPRNPVVSRLTERGRQNYERLSKLSDDELREVVNSMPDKAGTALLWDALERIKGYRATIDRMMTVPSNGTETSDAAAVSHSPTVPRLRILAAMVQHPEGLTSDDAEVATGIAHQTCSARINEMTKLGWVQPVIGHRGERMKRPTRTGNGAFVHTITGEGRRILREAP